MINGPLLTIEWPFTKPKLTQSGSGFSRFIPDISSNSDNHVEDGEQIGLGRKNSPHRPITIWDGFMQYRVCTGVTSVIIADKPSIVVLRTVCGNAQGQSPNSVGAFATVAKATNIVNLTKRNIVAIRRQYLAAVTVKFVDSFER
jgi:hypothetical protein